MTRKPNLVATEKECPPDCPFLIVRSWQPDTLPYFCGRYEVFLGVLGAAPSRRIARCHQCRGILPDAKRQGLAFIESYADLARIPETRQAFSEMDKIYRQAFSDLIARTGREIYLQENKPKTSDELANQALRIWRGEHDKRHAASALAFKSLVEKLTGDFTLLTRQTDMLLMNLFLVMDASEQAMLMSILQNRRQIEAFLEAFSKQPRDNDLLRNVRALVYDFDRQAEQERELEQERARRRQMDLEMMRRTHQAGRGGK
ncbi:MAG: hypothetical protein PHX68_01760 [Alphaproteobacteria bacterium]|nr:hypothetical protein [Alphaproteobacteria bacterium]